MRNVEVRWLAALTLTLAAACDAGEDSGDRPANMGGATTGGTTTGGVSATTGGTPAATGGATVTATPFPFPQNKKPPNCNLTSVAGASTLAQSAYQSWRNAFVTPSGGALRVRRPGNSDDTVSEGIAYGMLAALYMVDRATFDGLWSYAKSQFNANKLMSWHIASNGTKMDMGSAADADEDMAWALIGAAAQWGSAAYLSDAKSVIDAMYTTSIAADGRLKPGDSWGNTMDTFPDYFSPAYYRVFAKVSGNPNWGLSIIDRNYEILKNSSGTYGLVPDKTTGSYQPPAGFQDYKYDACRTPWRIAMDYCFNGEPRALEYLQKIAPFFDKIGAGNIVDGYRVDGTAIGNVRNMAFIGPAGVAGMVAHPSLLDGAFNFGTMNGGGDQAYYPQSLRVITLLMMSGNFIDLGKL
ncbi:MAG TPA: glycosyl hydrolase family 8 [Polyangiaceae bacterium]|nr:glycosyl hydrolase family 8 [Polyangiaceae bacterium]